MNASSLATLEVAVPRQGKLEIWEYGILFYSVIKFKIPTILFLRGRG